MFRKIVSAALLATIVSLPLIYLIVQQLQASSPAVLTCTFAAVVLVCSALSAWFTLRPARPQSAREPAKTRPAKRESAPKPASPATDNQSTHREYGQVKWFNASKGFGFITRENGEDIFVHFRSIRGDGHRVLKDGQRVEFSVSVGDKGLQADDVMAVAR
jgi:CspA family cold shock protein